MKRLEAEWQALVARSPKLQAAPTKLVESYRIVFYAGAMTAANTLWEAASSDASDKESFKKMDELFAELFEFEKHLAPGT